MFRKVKSADVRLGSIFFSSSAVFNLSATSVVEASIGFQHDDRCSLMI